MDAVKVFGYLPDAATCTLCWELFYEPVTLDCGHNFCSNCITGFWEGSSASCPQCKMTFASGILRPNRQLGNIAWLLKQLKLGEVEVVKKEGKQDLCKEHQKPQESFCKDDGNLLCSDCKVSQAHSNHMVVSLEQAAQDYKFELKVSLDVQNLRRDFIRASYADMRLEKQVLVRLMNDGAQKLSLEYKELLELMRTIQSEQLSFAKEIEKEIDEEISSLYKKRCSLKKLNSELQKKYGLPDREFLQDIKDIISKCKAETIQPLECPPPDAKEKLWDFTLRNLFLRDTLKRCRDTVPLQLKVEKAMVTLDPVTAFPKFVLSEDRKGVVHEPSVCSQETNPLAFDPAPCVLGSEGFTIGRHFWEVEIISEGTGWALGIAKESVNRKESLSLGEHEGIWALPAEEAGPLFEKGLTIKIRVYLYCDVGVLEFFDGFSRDLIASFSALSFGSEKVFPFFMLRRQHSHLKLCF